MVGGDHYVRDRYFLYHLGGWGGGKGGKSWVFEKTFGLLVTPLNHNRTASKVDNT